MPKRTNLRDRLPVPFTCALYPVSSLPVRVVCWDNFKNGCVKQKKQKNGKEKAIEMLEGESLLIKILKRGVWNRKSRRMEEKEQKKW